MVDLSEGNKNGRSAVEGYIQGGGGEWNSWGMGLLGGEGVENLGVL